MIGCECAVCRSNNPRNHRFRPSIAVTKDDRTILVDTTPELRVQALTFGLNHVDAVVITHTHADHIFGLDEIRRYNDLSGMPMPVYGDPAALADIRRIFRYIFVKTQEGGGKPRVELHEAQPEMSLCGMQVRTLEVMHGQLPIRAYRFDDMAYVTDVNHIPPESMEQLRNLKLLILDAVRYEPHSTHFGLYQSLEMIEQLQPQQALLTHLSHAFDHDEVNAQLPPHIQLAYDGQIVEL